MRSISIIVIFILLILFANEHLERKRSSTSKILDHVEIEKSTLILHPEEGKFYYKSKPFTGYAVMYYPNGNLKERSGFFEGKKEGIIQKWYKNKAVSYEANYKSNKLHGKINTWWSNGNLRSASNFSEGIAHGIQKQWYSSGAKFKELHLNFGQEEGLQKAWRENGKLYANYEAKNGRVFGLKRANLCFELEQEIIQAND